MEKAKAASYKPNTKPAMPGPTILKQPVMEKPTIRNTGAGVAKPGKFPGAK